MSPELALKLVPILEAYSSMDEFRELAALFEVTLTSLEEWEPTWLSIARELSEKLEHGNTRRLVDSLLELAESRNDDGIAHTTWERQTFHQSMTAAIRRAQELLTTSASPSEIAMAAGSVFSAKSRVRELLETATTDIFIVDPYVGVGTLDCLRSITRPMRLLVGTQPKAVEPGFDSSLAAFIAEGHPLAVRCIAQLHDRHLLFNDRAWLVGGSLKDAGKKPFNCIEISDQKAVVVADLEAKWQAAQPYP